MQIEPTSQSWSLMLYFANLICKGDVVGLRRRIQAQLLLLFEVKGSFCLLKFGKVVAMRLLVWFGFMPHQEIGRDVFLGESFCLGKCSKFGRRTTKRTATAVPADMSFLNLFLHIIKSDRSLYMLSLEGNDQLAEYQPCNYTKDDESPTSFLHFVTQSPSYHRFLLFHLKFGSFCWCGFFYFVDVLLFWLSFAFYLLFDMLESVRILQRYPFPSLFTFRKRSFILFTLGLKYRLFLSEFQKQHLLLVDKFTIYIFQETNAFLQSLFFFAKLLISQPLCIITFTLFSQFLLILLQPGKLFILNIITLHFLNIDQLILLQTNILLQGCDFQMQLCFLNLTLDQMLLLQLFRQMLHPLFQNLTSPLNIIQMFMQNVLSFSLICLLLQSLLDLVVLDYRLSSFDVVLLFQQSDFPCEFGLQFVKIFMLTLQQPFLDLQLFLLSYSDHNFLHLLFQSKSFSFPQLYLSLQSRNLDQETVSQHLLIIQSLIR